MLSILALVAGFAGILWSAGRFVDGASAIAALAGVSPLIIGLTVVGVGSSAPEILVSALAAWEGNGALAIGNAVGSNIANVGLVLGLTATIYGVTVRTEILRREYPVMLLVLLLAGGLMLNGELSRAEGLGLIGLLVLLIGLLVFVSRAGVTVDTRIDPLVADIAGESPPPTTLAGAVVATLVGLAALLVASRIVVWGAVNLAQTLGISDAIIGLTILALGTSLPEVAASMASAAKGHDDIAVGNVVGSNIANMLAVLGVAAVLHPTVVADELIWRDLPVMLCISIALGLLVLPRAANNRLQRGAGVVLLGSYGAYIGYLALVTGSAVMG
jgi:cation:H+ antiporter